ncbi:MAG: winged helix-turn-helix domain-containing protein [Colwellia sp.]|nr:winged helix-turn-helix domain-containing protein [Colwellia sp.]
MISLGCYKLDVDEMLLSRDGEKVILEPKVLEVLLYFVEHNERYITMAELHENLWQGRIVSDAAVRRIISKLRILFNDDHKDPNYIKSLSKKGYKLICNIEYIDEQLTESELSPESSVKTHESLLITSVTAKNTALISKNKTHKKTIVLTTFFFASVLLVLGVFYQEFTKDKKSEANSLVVSEVIKSLPGDKITVAQSLDNQFLAFSGKVSEEQGYQVFIKKNNTHDFMAVKANTFLPLALAFSANNKNLFYSDLREANSSLNIILLTEPPYIKETLLEGYFSIGNIFTSPDAELIYFSGQKHQNEPRLIYNYNINTKKTEQVTHSTQNYYFDIRGSISPNGELLAIVRYSAYEKVYEVRVINLTSKSIIYHRDPQNVIYDLKWLDNQYLSLLDEKQLVRININNGKEQELINKPHKLGDLHVLNSLHLLAIQDHSPKKTFFEQTLPFNNWNNKFTYYDKNEAGIYSIHHSLDDNSRLIMSYKDNIISLGKLNTQTAEITSYLKTEYELDHLDYSAIAAMELIKINHRIVLFNIKTKNLTYITSADEFIGDASFSSDGKSVLFSVKSHEQWEIKRYNILDNNITRILKGFRYVRPYKKGYIVADAQENLSFYNNNTQEQLKLNHRISYEPNTYWTVRGDFIYWSSHDLVTTTFSELNISNINHPVLTEKTFSYNKVRPYFSVKLDGSSLTYSQRGQENSTIVSLTLK